MSLGIYNIFEYKIQMITIYLVKAAFAIFLNIHIMVMVDTNR